MSRQPLEYTLPRRTRCDVGVKRPHYTMRAVIPVLTRMHRYFDVPSPTACWIWTGTKHRQGYGMIQVGRTTDGSYRKILAHRAMWEETVGPIPPGLELRHRCDQVACVNPSHLDLGTHADNMRDMHDRRRHPSIKLTSEMVQEIRARVQAGESQRNVASAYGVTFQLVSLIVRRTIWTHIP